MKKKMGLGIVLLLCTGVLAQVALAGGIDNKQNLSARYLATLSRNAAIDGADIAAYNPAGIMQQDNGLRVEADVQLLLKVYENRYTSVLDGHVMKDQDNPSVVPTFFTTYKSDNWGLFGSFTINGGGGDVDYKTGNALTNTIEASLVSTYGAAAGALSNEKIQADSYYLTYTLGGTFRFNEIFSVAAGGRYIDANRDVDAFSNTGGLGNIIAAYEEDADGWGYVLSVNIKPSDNLLLAFRYDSIVELEFDTKHESKTNALGNSILVSLGKVNNTSNDRDLPALLGVGVMFKPLDRLTLEGSFTYYFEKDADWDNKVSNVRNSWDLGIAATYALTDDFRVSLGYMRTDVGISVNDYSLIEQMSPVLDANSFSLGAGYDINDQAAVEFGAMLNVYDTGDDATTTGGVEYSKYNTGLALALIYAF